MCGFGGRVEWGEHSSLRKESEEKTSRANSRTAGWRAGVREQEADEAGACVLCLPHDRRQKLKLQGLNQKKKNFLVKS